VPRPTKLEFTGSRTAEMALSVRAYNLPRVVNIVGIKLLIARIAA
jgi:hypothetical protein